MLHLAVLQGKYQWQADQRAADDEQNVDLPGNFQPLQAVVKARSDTAQPGNQRGIPQHGTQNRETATHQFRFQQTRQCPYGNAECRHGRPAVGYRSEEHTSELQSLMRISYAVFCLQKKNKIIHKNTKNTPKYST